VSKSSRWALLLTGGYLVLAGAWILVSSTMAAALARNVEELEHLEMLKGWGFVAVTAAGLFVATRFALKRIEASAEEALRSERALLANERRSFAGLIASSVAHDANNVLAVVLTELELAKKTIEPGLRDRIREALDQLVQLNRRLVQAGRQVTMSVQPVEVTAVVREAVELVRSHPALRRAKVTVDLGAPVEVNANPTLLSQIVTNLVVNAGEATDGKGAVAVRVTTEGDRACLEVDDDGPGVPVERRAGLFDALVTTKPHGNGMGLFSVKAAALALGGSVSVDAASLGGARFRVTLPLRTSGSA
jgi:signal transduction histidine kinase